MSSHGFPETGSSRLLLAVLLSTPAFCDSVLEDKLLKAAAIITFVLRTRGGCGRRQRSPRKYLVRGESEVRFCKITPMGKRVRREKSESRE